MKIDKKTVEKLTLLPDDALWQVIKMIAQSNGVDVPDKKRPQDMDSLRRAMNTITDDDISRAFEIINTYKGGQNGQ